MQYLIVVDTKLNCMTIIRYITITDRYTGKDMFKGVCMHEDALKAEQ